MIADTCSTERRLTRWRPVFAPMLHSAALCRALAGLGIFQICCAALKVHVVDCPIDLVLRIPCPGCGASRGCAELLAGHFRLAMRLHALSPVLLMGLIALCWASCLSPTSRQAAAHRLDRLEQRIPFGLMLFVALLACWVDRLITFH